MLPVVARARPPLTAAVAARRAIIIQAAALLSTTAATTTSRKPPIPQNVKFVDQLRVVARGGQGGGGSSALFGRTGAPCVCRGTGACVVTV